MDFDCDGDGVEDFVIASPRWSSDPTDQIRNGSNERGKVVLYSGSNLKPLVTIVGESKRARCGSAATIVADVDGDQLADIAVAHQDGGEAWISVAIFSGCTGKLLRKIGRELLPEPHVVLLDSGVHDEPGSASVLMLSQPLAFGPLGIRQGVVLTYDVFAARIVHESYGTHDFSNYGAGLTRVSAGGQAHAGWASMISSDPAKLTVGLHRPKQAPREYALSEHAHFSKPSCSFSRRLGTLSSAGMSAALLCGATNKSVSGLGSDFVFALDAGPSKPIMILASQPTGSDFGSSVATSRNADGEIVGFLVGGPAAEASSGVVYFYRFDNHLSSPTLVRSKGLGGLFGCQMIELNDLNDDGYSDTAVVGEAGGEMGFEVVSGADGSILYSMCPGR